MIDTTLERQAGSCDECDLSSIAVFYVTIVMASGDKRIGALCLACLQSLGVKIAQAARERSRQGT